MTTELKLTGRKAISIIDEDKMFTIMKAGITGEYLLVYEDAYSGAEVWLLTESLLLRKLNHFTIEVTTAITMLKS